MSVYNSGHARRSLLDTIAFRVLSQVATVFGYVIMVRGMQKEDFGVFNLLYSFLPVVSTIASLGLFQTLRRFQPEYLKAGNSGAAAWLVRVVASWRFVTNVAILALVLAAWNWVAPAFKMEPYRGQFALFCVLILLHFQAAVFQFALASHMLHRMSMGAMALLSIIKLIGYGLFVWFDSLTLERAILVDTAGYFIVYLLLRIYYQRTCVDKAALASFKPEPTERKRLVRYAMFNNFNDAGTLFLDSKIDNFFIAAFIDPVSVGIYAFYTRLNDMIAGIAPVRLFENVVQPLFFSMSAGDADRRTSEYFTLLLNLNLLVQWPIFAYCLAYHGDIVQAVFGGKYIEQSWLLPLVVGFGIVNSIAMPATLVAQYQEKAGVILLSKVFAVYNVFAMMAFIPLAGLYGAAVASGSAQAMKNLFIWWKVRRSAVWTNRYAATVTSVLLWGGAVAAAYALKHWLPGHGMVHLLLGGAIFGAASLVYLRSPALCADDRRILGSIFHGKEARLMQRFGVLPAVGKAS